MNTIGRVAAALAFLLVAVPGCDGCDAVSAGDASIHDASTGDVVTQDAATRDASSQDRPVEDIARPDTAGTADAGVCPCGEPAAVTYQPTGATFHVDRGDLACDDEGPGTEATPWCTIAASVAVVQPGDMVLVADGRYGERFSFVTAGTAVAPIVYKAAGDDVVFGNFVDVIDEDLVAEPGYQNVWRITLAEEVSIDAPVVYQTHFDPILVDDTNPSRFIMVEEDGPIALTADSIAGLADVAQVEGSCWFDGDHTFYLHPFDDRAPSSTATDFVIGPKKWGSLYLDETMEYLTFDGFKLHYSAGYFWVVDGAHNTFRNIHTTTGMAIRGDYNLLENVSGAHGFSRKASDNYNWFTGNSGSSGGAGGLGTLVRRGHFYHGWNAFSGGGTDTVFDGLVIHGSPNHCWLPSGTNLTVRNLVEYNCQDYQYLNDIRGYRLENSIFPGGILLQAYPVGEAVIEGPIVLRNNILTDVGRVLNYSTTFPPPDCAWEAEVLIENNILLGTEMPSIGHCQGSPDNKVDYPLDEYVALCAGGTLTGCATVRQNLFLDLDEVDPATVVVGGLWEAETDFWDAHLTDGASPAVDRGAAVDFDQDFEGEPRLLGSAVDIGPDELCTCSR